MRDSKQASIVTNESPGRLIPETKTVNKTGVVEANSSQAENIVNNGNSMTTTTRAAKAAMKTEHKVTDKSNELKSVELVNKQANQQREHGDNSKTLTQQEEQLLKECEADIRDNLGATFLLGARLQQIRDQRLYRAHYSTFEQYCRSEWDFSKTHINRSIQAHLCEKNLKSNASTKVCIPTKESEARFIMDLAPNQQIEVAAEVLETVGDGRVKAKHFAEAREKLFPKPKILPKPESPEPPKPQADATSKVVALQFDTNLVSHRKMWEMLQIAYNTASSPGAKKQAIEAISKVQSQLNAWIVWENKHREQEVA